MLKKILSYIIVIVISFVIGLFISGKFNSKPDERIAELERISLEIRESQSKINNNIESIGNTIGGIKTDTNRLIERNKTIEAGINRLENNDRKNTEIIGNLIGGNIAIKELSEEYRKVTESIGRSIETIEEKNK